MHIVKMSATQHLAPHPIHQTTAPHHTYFATHLQAMLNAAEIAISHIRPLRPATCRCVRVPQSKYAPSSRGVIATQHTHTTPGHRVCTASETGTFNHIPSSHALPRL